MWAVEPAPALSDRKIAERLTRLETRLDEGLKALRPLGSGPACPPRSRVGGRAGGLDIQQLREDMGQLREDMNRQNQQLREDMNLQFARQFQLTLALLGAFAVLVAGTISFAVWDRRTMIRPFERTVQSIQEDLSTNRNRLDALLEAFRALGQRNPEVAAVLKQFNLL